MDPSKQAEVMTRFIEGRHPDAEVTVTAQPDGARIVISGHKKAPGLSGPGDIIDVELRVSENSPLLLRMLNARI